MPGPPTLFPPSLLPASLPSSLPPGYALRPLARDDHGRGFFACLEEVLTWVGDPTEAEFRARYDEMADARGTYYFAVIEHAGRVVGTGCLVVEKKLIHNCTKVGHVEEIAVSAAHQGKGLGRAMMRALDGVARAVGCEKSVLNCGPRNEAFYAGCGYRNSGIEMTREFVGGEGGEEVGGGQ
ncbi:acyl-CoA N-acyltransferase [Xylariaceae sp. FL0016]|nr:acyl-CoA N-acyltransferase [Xylariaceae sp. FL0016]